MITSFFWISIFIWCIYWTPMARCEAKDARGLVLVVVGSNLNYRLWTKQKRVDNWDIAALYYGTDITSFNCPECVAIQHGQGAKWYLVNLFLNSSDWLGNLQHRYSAVMIPDDDLVMNADIISSTFRVFHNHNLTLAQPSLCTPCSYTAWPLLYQQTSNLLRYTSFVELMTPIFTTPFFNATVRETTEEADVGWGLDHIWGLLLGFPQDEIAVIDIVCVAHPGNANKQGALYTSNQLVRSPIEERKYLQKKWGYTRWKLWKHHIQWHTPKQWSVVPLTPSAVKERQIKWQDNVCGVLPSNIDAERQVNAPDQLEVGIFLMQMGVLGLMCFVTFMALYFRPQFSGSSDGSSSFKLLPKFQGRNSRWTT